MSYTQIEHERRPRAQILGAILWPAFFCACLASIAVFAFFDPIDLAHAIDPLMAVSSIAVYSIGFLFFWALCTAATTFCWILLRPGSRFNR